MLLALAALLAGAGGEILEARLRAELGDPPEVKVHLEYRIELPEGRDRLSFSALDVGEAKVKKLDAFASGVPLPVELEPRSSRKLRGTLVIPKGSSSPLDLELIYVVRNGAEPRADGIRASLPLPILDLGVAERGSRLFSAVIELPPGLRVVDGFPSNHQREEDGRYRWELPLVPAFLSFHASSGSGLLRPPFLASATLVVLLLTAGLVGYRRARAMRP